MTGKWLRQLTLLSACILALVLSACGSSTIESALNPTRLISFGDGMSDIGQSGTRYTVKDDSLSIWSEQVASRYSLEIKPVAQGGLSYAYGLTRITQNPNAGSGLANQPLTIKEQIDRFAAEGQAFRSDDVVLINGGIDDMLWNVQRFADLASLEAASVEAGKNMAAQVRRLSEMGAKHVLIVGLYDLSRSPWGKSTNRADEISKATLKFNEAMLVAMNDLGNTTLYFDLAYYLNLVTANPASYGFSNSKDIVCTSVDQGAGIGIGAGEVNSGHCTKETLIPDVDYNRYIFADKVYLTPAAQRLLGNQVFDRLRNRW